MLSEFNYGGPVMQAIVNRRNNYHFSNHPVSRSSIETLLESGMRVSLKNEADRWSFVVIQDEDYVRYLREYSALLNILDGKYNSATQKIVAQDASLNSGGAGSLILVCANLAMPFSLDHCWLAVENMLLTGSALGFGISLDGSLLKVLNLSMIKSELNMPEELTVLAAMMVGEPENPILPVNNYSPKVWKWLS
ncbi:nitroreductase family protein [Polynucleobacter sinensis]|uniref:nitroreductase family protein n=1 Tax=Polynucleobacter sinensis TaxID=1743157 RepID=UPI0007866E5E|nr:nitroreductase family protein [Polynucleobacter sinensis]